MKKESREKLNLFFSSFLVIGFIICTYFFMTLTSKVSAGVGNLISVVVFILFGLIVFYATRVGEGVPVKRFSPIVLCVLDIPALFIIIATLAPAFPLHNALATQPTVMTFACVALGYGIPYTFLSGFEIKEEIDEEAIKEAMVEGGLAQELAQLEEAETEETVEAVEINDEVATDEDVAELSALDGAEDVATDAE
ncbi:MAG: hypothetical protein IJO20_06160 [Ruminococcus sp.]|nr:hypothetical protein [Ruminococcus sp.]MBQ7134062.1 hypothetical protein [Ruminococcus sp.]